MYSSVLVGLMNRVDSLRANGSRQTSQPVEIRRQLLRSCAGRSSGCSDGAAASPGSIFTTGPDHARSATPDARRAIASQQRQIDALVDHAEEAQARMRQRAPGRPASVMPLRGRREVLRHRRCSGKQCTFGWRSFLARYRLGPPVNTTSAMLQQLRLALEQLRRRVQERRQLVHAVVDRRPAGCKLVGQRQRHRRVEPEDVILQILRLDQFAQQCAKCGICSSQKPGASQGVCGRQTRTFGSGLSKCHSTMRRFPRSRLLYKNYTMACRETGEQMLRALVNEIPTQVGKRNDCRGVFQFIPPACSEPLVLWRRAQGRLSRRPLSRPPPRTRSASSRSRTMARSRVGPIEPTGMPIWPRSRRSSAPASQHRARAASAGARAGG